ncbi:MAG: prepilin-type N-terminal cleavage/methylation domain-containing protein [Candidatus Paceibacterota bacterium]
MSRIHKKQKGFTLLELIVVVVVLGILAALAIPTFNTIKQKSIDSSALKSAQSIARSANSIASFDGRNTNDTDIDSAAAELSSGSYSTATNTVTITSGGFTGNAYIQLSDGEAVATLGIGTATSTPGLYQYVAGSGFPNTLKLYVGGSGEDMGKLNEAIADATSPDLHDNLVTAATWSVTLSDGLNAAAFTYNRSVGAGVVTLQPVGIDQAEIDAEFMGNLRPITAIQVNIVTQTIQINVA